MQPKEREMKLECSKCDSNVVQILMGVDDSRYTQCLGCGWLTQVKREPDTSEEFGWLPVPRREGLSTTATPTVAPPG
jgi:hypothetical protein